MHQQFTYIEKVRRSTIHSYSPLHVHISANAHLRSCTWPFGPGFWANGKSPCRGTFCSTSSLSIPHIRGGRDTCAWAEHRRHCHGLSRRGLIPAVLTPPSSSLSPVSLFLTACASMLYCRIFINPIISLSSHLSVWIICFFKLRALHASIIPRLETGLRIRCEQLLRFYNPAHCNGKTDVHACFYVCMYTYS